MSGNDGGAGEVRVERLLGRDVRDRDGRAVGRLEELSVAKEGAEHLVVEYLIGTSGLMERLFNRVQILRSKERRLSGFAARWDQVDISDPEHPVLTCSMAEVRRL